MVRLEPFIYWLANGFRQVTQCPRSCASVVAGIPLLMATILVLKRWNIVLNRAAREFRLNIITLTAIVVGGSASIVSITQFFRKS